MRRRLGFVILSVSFSFALRKQTLIIFGTYECGSVDRIEGVGHVATSFAHVQFIPLVPVQSRFYKHLGQDETGCKIAMNFRSIVKGYGQAALVVLTIIAATTCFMIKDVQTAAISIGFVLTGVVAFFFWNKVWRYATYERAKRHVDDVGFDKEVKIFVDLHFEKIDQAEADRQIDQHQDDVASGKAMQDALDTARYIR